MYLKEKKQRNSLKINKGTTINDLGLGPEEIEKKKLEALIQEKNKF